MDNKADPTRARLPLAASCYIAATAMGAAASLWWLAQRDLAVHPLPAFTLLAVLAIAIGSRPIIVRYRGQTFQFSLESALVLALMTIYGILPAAILQAVTSVISDLATRKPWPKSLFNASQLVLATVAAGIVLETALGREIRPPGMSFGAGQLSALLLALATFFLVNTLFTSLILRLAAGQTTSDIIREFVLSQGSAIEAAALLLAPPVAVIARHNPLLALLLIVPIAAMHQATKVALENLTLVEDQRIALEEKRAAEEAAREREAARAAAEKANRAKSEFLSQMSHELRTPLNAALGFAQLLEMDQLTPDQKAATGHIIKAGQHILELVNEVLDIARIETGRMQLSLEPVDAFEVAEQCISLLAPLADRDEISLVLEQSDIAARSQVIADRQRLAQVMINLISNGIKYNCDHGSVRVSFRSAGEGRQLKIDVADTGRGIPPERMGHLFTPFDRLGAEGSGIEGTGLGLALSKPLMEAMGGKLEATSEPGKGTVFSVELELAEPATTPTLPFGTDPLAPRSPV